MITRERLLAQRVDLEQDILKLQANLHATTGAIQILDKLLAELDAAAQVAVLEPPNDPNNPGF